MLFTINDLGFSIAGLLLEGWLAFAARCVCALALLFIGWVVSRWMQKKLFPRLLKRSWHFAFTHPLLESFARPAARIAWYTGMYLALRSLPWAIPGLAALLLKAYRMMLVFLIGTGFYHASGIAALLRRRSCRPAPRGSRPESPRAGRNPPRRRRFARTRRAQRTAPAPPPRRRGRPGQWAG